MVSEKVARELPTLRQVAAAAGVSIKTASRALNGEAHVAPATSDRVKEAASALGYRRNLLARDLRAHAGADVVGMVIADAANPFYADIALAAGAVLGEQGLLLFIGVSDKDPASEERIISGFLERRVAGLLVVSSREDHPQLRSEAERGVPTVFLDRPARDLAVDEVLFDNLEGARAAVDHLLEQGHRRIGVIGDLGSLPTHHERIAGVRRALTEAGVPVREDLFVTDVHDADGAEAAMRGLLTLSAPPTAVFTTNNRMAVGALRAVSRRDDLPALIGFDDFELAEVLGMSVVSNSPAEMGERGARMLLERVRGGSGPSRRVRLATELVVRRSTVTPLERSGGDDRAAVTGRRSPDAPRPEPPVVRVRSGALSPPSRRGRGRRQP
ncbi:LacI family DNA-binding transcriptional regulator [Brachybacterium fresconis]|uniref:LacI family transcriptional regulator n=1 Tax=Brachybacterium fresconis TaxID=173363 RepID=A0ABS4YLT4_9MICO|nr:LacI family DNA-binding transcriptional regulator [Brachybacterium fresconis]MBP2409460.1 LacI family transcriptional regulator [Brachybacterium fresconis]MDN5655236.1 LacI family transcriptional regulator [Kocuria sp.]